MIVAAWVILSAIGFIAITSIKKDLGELVNKGLMVAQIVGLGLSTVWLLNASF